MRAATRSVRMAAREQREHDRHARRRRRASSATPVAKMNPIDAGSGTAVTPANAGAPALVGTGAAVEPVFQVLPAAPPTTMILLSVRLMFPPLTETLGTLIMRWLLPSDSRCSDPAVTLTAELLVKFPAMASVPALTLVAPL